MTGDSNETRACPACAADGATPAGEENGWALARCGRCGVRFTVEAPTDEHLQEIYNRIYSEGDAYQMHLDQIRELEAKGKRKPGLYRSLIFLNRYKPKPDDRLLEVGCGVGLFLSAANRKGWQVEGIDLSETALQASRDVHHLPVRQGRFDELDFDEGAYSVIATFEVLEHLTDPRGFLEKAKRLLKPGGLLVCSVPNEGAKVPFPPVRGQASTPPVHLNFWDRAALTRFFELNGYRVERMITQRTMNSVVHPREDAKRFLRLQAGAAFGRYEGIHLFAAARPAG
ncbi:MAG TPA: methyltransferase domain-containing protein [Thermoleophilaceae bacterium]|jgi:2-polyprenyl-3-methyl-5-hydroxy-6-metoxy-1,4-benzoquinol methylase